MPSSYATGPFNVSPQASPSRRYSGGDQADDLLPSTGTRSCHQARLAYLGANRSRTDRGSEVARFAAGRIPPSHRRPWLLAPFTVIMISMGLLLAGIRTAADRKSTRL